MACFCEQAVTAAQKRRRPEPVIRDPSPPATPDEQIVAAASDWLAARWLPAPPWAPDPEWMEEELAPPPLPPEALAVLCNLLQAGQSCTEVLDIDPAEPKQVRRLTRLVATLNRRSAAALAEMLHDDEVWGRLAAQNAQADAVLATPPELFDPEQPDPSPPPGPWRKLIGKVKALAPLVAIGQMLDLDLADPQAPAEIARKVRTLRAIALPPLAQPLLVHRLVARASALDRLRRSLGIEPDEQPIEEVADLVRQKIARAADALPETLRPNPQDFIGLPDRAPNPTQLINPAVMAVVRKVPNQALPWKVPTYDQLPLLRTGAPVLTLARLLGPVFIRSRPCQNTCDAAAALRDAEAAPAAQDPATMSTGSGIGAVPAK